MEDPSPSPAPRGAAPPGMPPSSPAAAGPPLGRLLDPELLRAFVAVVDCNGHTHAAHHLHRTQAAVSQQVSRLEDAVGTALFAGPKRHLRLTAAGGVLLDYARRLLALNQEALERLRPEPVSGTVRMGATHYYATSVLPGLLAEFSRRHPGIHIEMEVGVADDMQRKLGRAYDLIINAFPGGSGRGVLLRREAVVWAAARDGDAPARDPVPLAVLPPGSLLRKWAEAALTAAGRRWVVVQESLSIEVLKASVRAGAAVGVFQAATVQTAPPLRVLDAADGFPPLPASEMWLDKADRALPKAASCLYDFLREQLPPWQEAEAPSGAGDPG